MESQAVEVELFERARGGSEDAKDDGDGKGMGRAAVFVGREDAQVGKEGRVAGDGDAGELGNAEVGVARGKECVRRLLVRAKDSAGRMTSSSSGSSLVGAKRARRAGVRFGYPGMRRARMPGGRWATRVRAASMVSGRTLEMWRSREAREQRWRQLGR